MWADLRSFRDSCQWPIILRFAERRQELWLIEPRRFEGHGITTATGYVIDAACMFTASRFADRMVVKSALTALGRIEFRYMPDSALSAMTTAITQYRSPNWLAF